MKFHRFAAAAALAVCLPALHAEPVKGKPLFTFNKAAYELRLRQAFDGQAMGWAVVLLNQGQPASQLADGLARNAADTQADMTVTMPANVGSSIKFTAGVTLLRLFESADKTINPNGWTVEQWLARPVWTYFPKVWQDGMHDSIKAITFGDLLRHESGFRNLEKENFGDDGVKRMYDYLVLGVKAEDRNDKSVYANANISLVTYLIPMIANPALRAQVDADVKKNAWTPEGLPLHRRIADVWETYMHQQVYAKLLTPIKPSCNPTEEYPARHMNWAPYYQSVHDHAEGTTGDSRDNNGYCQGQGGWYITARELAMYVAHFNTGHLVSPATRQLMLGASNGNDRLVWSFMHYDTQLKDRFGTGWMRYMGGDDGGARATIVMLPGGYTGVALVNSPPLDSNAITRRVVRAFKTSIGIPEDPACPGLPHAIQSAKAKVAVAQAELKQAQAELQEAVNEGIKGGYYAQAVKNAREKLDAANAALKSLQGQWDGLVCMP